jgi:hypothetical protein
VNPTLRSLLRFWWLVLAGLVLGVIAGYLALSAKSDNKKYVATAKIFVNSPAGPYLRTQVTQVTPQSTQPQVLKTAKTTGTGAQTSVQLVRSPPVVTSEAPDTATLVTAANLYPLLIVSDEVAAVSPAPSGCKIDATGVFASTNTFGVFKASPVPVVAVKSTCKSKNSAMPSSQNRVLGFQKWIVQQQDKDRIPLKQRLLVQELAAPTSTATIGGRSAGLPLFVGVVVFLLFCGLAILLDRRRSGEQGKDSSEPAPPPAAPNPSS